MERSKLHRPPKLILASASPRRYELLKMLDLEFIQQPADIDEEPQADEQAEPYVLRLAFDKANAVWNTSDKSTPVLGADTTVVVDQKLIGKPTSKAEAVEILKCLRQREHRVFTAVSLLLPPEPQVHQFCCSSTVEFGELTDQTLEDFVSSYWQEIRDKAGAYAIQGRTAAFIRSINGSHTNIMGLPLFEVCSLLRKLDIL